ncbi:SMI1/KNR4 family protein [Priestia megaterium]|uniref:SMI1/KNR4 family protein n=1 Tax=Priestia megaterium TaxID=1404 RepID=UPI0025A3B7AF|nr:SMI1/KNR4 family protein [Priestia megaterium]MDM8147301.1 SMI1/KNR4 family protein [Priestia megaterium]
MRVVKESVIYPLPADQDIAKLEASFRIQLPNAYKQFLKHYNGCTVIDSTPLTAINKRWQIERFLGIIKNFSEHPYGVYDIGCCETSLGEQGRNFYDEDLIGSELIPIAKLAWGDYLCLNFHYDKNNPSVDFLDYEESYECDPATSKIAETFQEFLSMLLSEDTK